MKHEYEILANTALKDLQIPEAVEFGLHEGHEYLVLEMLPGKRLSFMQDEYQSDSRGYCRKFGRNLARIHSLKIEAPAEKARKYHSPPEAGSGGYITEVNAWLRDCVPERKENGFVHGDHHYANLLWENGDISAILDWELSGRGNREFDLAWAVFLRPGQKFFDSREEEDLILTGYSDFLTSSMADYEYFKVQVMAHFHTFINDDAAYRKWLEIEIRRLTGISGPSGN